MPSNTPARLSQQDLLDQTLGKHHFSHSSLAIRGTAWLSFAMKKLRWSPLFLTCFTSTLANEDRPIRPIFV
jgi:hypothetical protein